MPHASNNKSLPDVALSCGLWLVACGFAVLLSAVTIGCDDGTTHTFSGDMKKKFENLTPAQLMAMVSDENPDVRREGLLGLSKHPEAFDDKALKLYAFIATTTAEEVPVRAVCLDVLGRAGNAKYLPTVVQCLDDDSPRVRLEAAMAMDGVHGPEAVEPLRRHVVSDDSAEVRTACAKALRAYKQQDVTATLARVLNDGDFSVRYRAHTSLVEITAKDLGTETDPWLDFSETMKDSTATPHATVTTTAPDR